MTKNSSKSHKCEFNFYQIYTIKREITEYFDIKLFPPNIKKW